MATNTKMEDRNNGQPPQRSWLAFFVLVYALTLPCWLLGHYFDWRVTPDRLPVTDVVATFMPMVAGIILQYKNHGATGVLTLLKRLFDARKIKNYLWLVVIVLLPIVHYVSSYMIMKAQGISLPDTWPIPLRVPLLLVTFFVAAAGEELGYMGYEIDLLQARFTALNAAQIMGTIWALWHLPSMILIGQSPPLIVWGLLATVAFRVLYLWLYNNTGGSVFAVILFHALFNTGRSLFPGGRSAFEHGHAAIGYGLVIFTAVLITFLWGAKSLNDFKLRPPLSRHP